jgi:TonB-dependent starch-binding outer membrane protein SusC
MVGSTTIAIPWIEGLSYELNYSNTFINGFNNQFWPNTIPAGADNNGQARKEPWQQRNWIYNNILTYQQNFGDHQVHSTFLYSREHRNNQWSYLNAQGFDNPTLGYNRMSLGTIVNVNSSAWEENSLSYMGRLSYTYLSRYLLTATIRHDGFSGFGPEE